MSRKKKDNCSLPIGVFDSGLGGLTVVSEMQRMLPDENIIYLGDSARVPYGTRSAATIERYAWNCAEFLVSKGLKMLVVACNTASAVAIDSLQKRVEQPVLGVIKAGARQAASATKTGRVGVIGTAGTISSGAYPKIISEINSGIVVYQNSAPLLVPLVEEGWISGDVPALAVNRYLESLVAENIDVLMLGCTHYPVLRKVIEKVLKTMGSEASVVDSAVSMSIEVKNALEANELLNNSGCEGILTCFVTDLPDSFQGVAGRFLGKHVGNVEKVDIT